ncbi:aminotransferase class V-fold PLP-dependent enzyme [Patescibacteria group bacterium]
MTFNTDNIRKQFPITKRQVRILDHDDPQPLIYFDHAASTHPVRRALDRYVDFLNNDYANIHRGNHLLSELATQQFENARTDIINFIKGDPKTNTIIFSDNTTSALSLASHIMSGEEGIVVTSLFEHHSNDLTHRQHSDVKHVNPKEDGTYDLEALEDVLKNNKVKLVAVTAASNSTGYMPPLAEIATLAHKHGAKILVDAAQILAHAQLQVYKDDDPRHLDFVAAAGHKAYAPFGSAFLFGPKEIFDKSEPYRPGGGTVKWVTTDAVSYQPSPERHEGGTPNIAGGIALAESLAFLKDIGLENIRTHEKELTQHLIDGIANIKGVVVYGPLDVEERIGIVTFNINEIDHSTVASILDQEYGIAVRNGCFCAHPYLHYLLEIDPADVEKYKEQLEENDKTKVPGAVRASIGIYNSKEEIDVLIKAIKKIAKKEWSGDYSGVKAPCSSS